MDDITRDPVLRALAAARPTSADTSADDAQTLLARLDSSPRTETHHLRSMGRVAAVATLAVAATVSGLALTAGSPFRRPGTVTRVALQTISDNTRRAMAHAASSLIEYDQITVRTSTGGYIADTDMWRFGSSVRGEMVGAGGATRLDVSRTTVNGTTTSTVVDYVNKAYSTSTKNDSPAILSLIDPSSQIRSELADGTLTEVGQRPLNGVPAIELEGSTGIKGIGFSPIPFAFAVPAGHGSAPTPPTSRATGSKTMTTATGPRSVEWWVDPTTFLPIKQLVTTTPGFTITSSISWLTPSPSNRADLIATIPSGFRQVPGPIWITATQN